MSNALPAVVIGGYLGAGKTTLVNHMLRHANGQRLAVLVNEFGALPIDEDLIEAASDDLISIAGGCICCSFGSDLAAALVDMSNRIPRPDHLIIEASGVAMPGSIAASIGLLENISLSGVLVLADANTASEQLSDEYIADTLHRQLTEADVIVATKSDLTATTDLQKTVDQLRSINPVASLLTADHGKLPVDILLGHHTGKSDLEVSVHADEAYESFVFEIPDGCQMEFERVIRIAKEITKSENGILRCKGFVSDKEDGSWLLQTVSRRFEVSRFAAKMRSQLVFIGLRGQFDKSALQAQLVHLI